MPAPTGTGVFPVAGPHTYGDGFGAGRSGHTHQGQDILAASGTPVVAPVAGTISSTAYQAGGAGYYIVEHAVDGRDLFFAHCLANSTTVSTGQAVAEGQQLCAVGMTGDATGPHLHFEIWPNGWHAAGSQPIDPLPQLQAWDA
jgi:murein DD-endopeptidase MepM/ murein hydrolase activator NlpD